MVYLQYTVVVNSTYFVSYFICASTLRITLFLRKAVFPLRFVKLFLTLLPLPASIVDIPFSLVCTMQASSDKTSLLAYIFGTHN